ncbi:MAG: manganese-dependent inorganic pyrophosphatase [Candidatus Nanoarchaeia archaeon]
MAKIYVIGHKCPDTDSVVAAIAYAKFKSLVDLDDEYLPARAGALNPETEYVLNRFKLPAPELLSDAAGKKLILVDHNEMGQVVDGADQAIIFEIIDHHKVGGFQSSSPILFHAEPVGSTATIVADFFFYHKVPLSKQLASALLAAILSDTVIFKSPTTTDKDRRLAEQLNKIAKLDLVPFGLEVKKAKASIKKLTANEVIMIDFKAFDKDCFKYGIGQLEVVDYVEADERKDELLKELESVRVAGGLKLACLMVTNIISEVTRLWFTGDTVIIENAFGKKSKDNEVLLPGVMSRKKQVVPKIQDAL